MFMIYELFSPGPAVAHPPRSSTSMFQCSISSGMAGRQGALYYVTRSSASSLRQAYAQTMHTYFHLEASADRGRIY